MRSDSTYWSVSQTFKSRLLSDLLSRTTGNATASHNVVMRSLSMRFVFQCCVGPIV